ncbi:hypothetical protein BGZ60DRAFT_532237 [Tricladium varicosporioides]|nr:hypothetical protein BGZ60DRAFT_532237 [Hymenoscyphus varicosporioides]
MKPLIVLGVLVLGVVGLRDEKRGTPSSPAIQNVAAGSYLGNEINEWATSLVKFNLQDAQLPPYNLLDVQLLPTSYQNLYADAINFLIPDYRFQKYLIPRDATVFYSSGQQDDAAKFASEKRFYDFRRLFEGPEKAIPPGELYDRQKLVVLSAAMARASRGIVWVLMPREGIDENAIFAMTEWPELMGNDKVCKVVWVNKDNYLHTEVLWEEGDQRKSFPLKTHVTRIHSLLKHQIAS